MSESGHGRLERALSSNEPLAKAYYLKEKLQAIWKQSERMSAEKWLDDWVDEAFNSEVPMLKSFAKTVVRFKEGILAYYEERMSSGPVEGVNNRLKNIVKQAYGYRDWTF